MGVITTNSTLPDGWTPICNECGVALCYDISHYDYLAHKIFWDGWVCEDCNPHYKLDFVRLHGSEYV